MGYHLTKALLDRNHEVYGLSRTGEQSDLQMQVWSCDILDKDPLKKLLADLRPDNIIHLAAPAYIPDSLLNPDETYNVILHGTLNLLNVIRELGLPTKLLYVSSADVYGKINTADPLKENCYYDPINPYSAGKACAELACRQFHSTYGLDVIIARPFNHTGPGQSASFVCSNFARQIAEISMQETGSNIIKTGNIHVSRDFLDVRDVTNAYCLLLEKGISGEVYNVCSGQAYLLEDVVDNLFRIAGIQQYQIVTSREKVREKDIPIRIGCNHKLIEQTGWGMHYHLDKTLEDLYCYWRDRL